MEAISPKEGCDTCLEGFEHIQKITEDLISFCPWCSNPIRQVMSVNTFLLEGPDWTRKGC